MPENEKNYEELVTEYREKLEFSADDKELSDAIDNAIKNSKELKEEMDIVGQYNKNFWKNGTKEDFARYHPNKAKVINNRIFTDVETAIPIITSETPEPAIITIGQNDQKNKMKDALMIAYEVTYRMQKMLQKVTRHWFLNRIGVLKYWWDEEKGFRIKPVLARKMGFDKTADDLDDAEYVWELVETTMEKLVAKFPKKKDEIIQASGGGYQPKTKIKYYEFWGGNGAWYACKLVNASNVILAKRKNPNWDYEEEENNLFDKPTFPYLLMNVFNLGDDKGLYDDTSLIEQASFLQEAVNKLEMQILDLNEGQKRVWVASGDGVSEQIFQKLIDKTGDLGIFLDKKASASSISQVQSGKPDASLFNNLTHLLGEIDNVIGMHSTTRGERQEQETLGGRKLLKGADMGRLDMVVRNIEEIVEQFYMALLHMIKVYGDEKIEFVGIDKKGELKPEEIPSDTRIMVKKGSTLPTDDVSRFQMADKLAAQGMVDPATMFEEMGFSNVEKRVNDLYRWLALTGKINPEMLKNTQNLTKQPEGASAIAGRVKEILESENFQKLNDEDKAQYIPVLRNVLQSAKQQA